MKKTELGDIQWVHCNKCLRETRHEVVTIRELKESEDIEPDFTIDWITTNTMLECRGCGNVALRRRVVSDDVDVDNTNYYPPPISRQIPRWQYKLPKDMSDLLKESYVALQSGSKRLAIMGARSLVDLFMNSTLGDIGGFEHKLDGLVKNGNLSKQNRDVLEAALEAGHAVVHRGHEPKADDVNLVFDIVENMLQTMVLQKESTELKKRTPQRTKSNKPDAGDGK
ncbi:MAG: DUF4145 domain-containing protein [Nitrospirota bacterium]